MMFRYSRVDQIQLGTAHRRDVQTGFRFKGNCLQDQIGMAQLRRVFAIRVIAMIGMSCSLAIAAASDHLARFSPIPRSKQHGIFFRLIDQRVNRMRRLACNAQRLHFHQLVGQVFTEQIRASDSKQDDFPRPRQHFAGLLDSFLFVVFKRNLDDIMILRDDFGGWYRSSIR